MSLLHLIPARSPLPLTLVSPLKSQSDYSIVSIDYILNAQDSDPASPRSRLQNSTQLESLF